MEVPIRLVRREVAQPGADAFVLFADSPAPLAAACARLGGARPQVFIVRGGFLLVPGAAETRSVPGTVRLRRLSGDLFIPADADLVPALLPDEASALTRKRGLIVLSGPPVLAFDPTAPLPVGRWLAAARVRRDEWAPFPQRPERPHGLSAIERPAPPVSAVIDVLELGAPDDAHPLPGPGEGAGEAVPEDARPPAPGSVIGRTAAAAGLATAGFLAWLGRQLGAAGLARLGGALARRALEAVPRLSERVLGAQEAALRDVLRELQAGDVEKGLRRAPPAVPDPDRPARIGTDARLGSRDPRYSLRDLIGAGGGAGTVWLGGGDVWAELAREYRRLAAEATARGDHRRAAYLYGVLLRDLRAAANALLAGALYRDAALLLRDRLNDPLGAADAFERAGAHDEAVRLYDRLGKYEQAGDLLHRLGEDARAVSYYTRAAERLAADRRYLAAGDLMRTKAHLRDEALAFYRRGWRADGAEAVTCAERVLDEYLASRNRSAVEELWAEAEGALADRPRDAGRFFNYALRVGEGALPADAHADLTDRARLLFATHLRAHATIGEAGALVDALFPAARPWEAPVIRDAAFVARTRRPEPPPRDAPAALPASAVRITSGEVTAVAVVRGTFDLIVAGGDGIVRWNVSDGRVIPVWPGRERVVALAASKRGKLVYALEREPSGNGLLRAFAENPAGPYLPTARHAVPFADAGDEPIFLQPAAVPRHKDHRITVATPVECLSFVGPYLGRATDDVIIEDRPVRLLVEAGDGYAWSWAGAYVRCCGPDETRKAWHMAWEPTGGVDWLTPGPGVLEIAAVDGEGGLHWVRYNGRDSGGQSSSSAFDSGPLRYTTACLVGSDDVAAVTSGNDVCWLRAVGPKLKVVASAALGVPGRVVSLSAGSDLKELIAVFADGFAMRVHRL